MACAFGMEACKQYYTVKYVRLPDLLLDLQAARADGNVVNVLKKLSDRGKIRLVGNGRAAYYELIK